MKAGKVTAAVAAPPADVEGLELVVERLRADLRRAEEEIDEVTEERDRLSRENSQYEVDMERRVELTRAQHAALDHGRAVLESVADNGDSFARTMNERAIDALCELLGDR